MEEIEEKNIYLTPAGVKKIKSLYQKLLRRQKEKAVKKRSGEPRELEEQNQDADPEVSVTDEKLLLTQIERYKFILEHYHPISPPQGEAKKKVGLGATLFVEINGQKQKLYIVDSPEADPSQGKVSRFSPIAKALIGRREGEEIKIQTESVQVIKIRKIRY